MATKRDKAARREPGRFVLDRIPTAEVSDRLDQYPDEVRQIAVWVAEHFSRTGLWPRQTDVWREIARRGLSHDAIVQGGNQIFSHLDSSPRDAETVELRPWALFDTGLGVVAVGNDGTSRPEELIPGAALVESSSVPATESHVTRARSSDGWMATPTKLRLRTDDEGRLVGMPTLPPRIRVEVTVRVLDGPTAARSYTPRQGQFLAFISRYKQQHLDADVSMHQPAVDAVPLDRARRS